MQTQCPHCDTRFRITETQANLAEGFVRCSVCKEVFNAFVVANQHDSQTSLLEDAPADNTDGSESKPIDSTPATDNVSVTNIPEQHSQYSKNKNDAEDLTATSNLDSDETAVTTKSNKDSFDFFDEEDASLSHVVPEQYRDSYAASSSLMANLLWTTGILILTATLSAQYAWFNRDQLNQVPQIQTWLEKICQQFECKDISMRDPSKIELISRNVYSHPNEKKALMINVTMKNNANFAQPYPVMQIGFSDVRGGIVVARRFQPAEYLSAQPSDGDPQATESWANSLFEPGTNMTFTMEIQDPGKQAMTYEFDFL